VDKVILTSTDKAVNPSNAMGTSKLMAEKLITAANYYKGERKTVFATVRFGNVLGSRGSVIPLFKQQIKEGGHVTITHPDMTRYVISLAESINLIFYATKMALGGEIFIPRMPAVKIVDLANAMIEELAPKYGYNPKDVTVEIIGVKPGEKLYEEIMTEEEFSRALETDKMFIVLPQLMDEFRHIDYKYTGAQMITSQDYTSRDANFLQKDEIKLLLHKEGLLEE
jgi:FlaA1/EpsC-like NDP-sugar epimerase